MRRYLGRLQSLRKIAFRRDSYKISWVPVEHYYVYRVPIGRTEEKEIAGAAEDLAEEDPADPESDGRSEKLWEQQHRNRILLEADKYVRLLPELQWLYFGHIPMAVTKSADAKEGRKVVALSSERDDCWTLLRRMFGRENASGS